MGHYEEVKIKCKLSDFGIEILEDLRREKSWLELAKYHPQYPFLEIASRIAAGGRYAGNNQSLLSDYPDIDKNNNAKVFEYEFYDKIDDHKVSLLKFVMPYLAEEAVYFYYWNEFYDSCDSPFSPKKADESYLQPKQPKLDWYRKFGESTYDEVYDE